MTIRIIFFATIRDRAGLRETTMNLPEGERVSALKAALRVRFPSLESALASVLVAVNREYATDDTVIPPGAEVALFPPVSGGTSSLVASN